VQENLSTWAPTTGLRRRFLAWPALTAFQARWNTALYFQLRSKTASGSLEAECARAPQSVSPAAVLAAANDAISSTQSLPVSKTSVVALPISVTTVTATRALVSAVVNLYARDVYLESLCVKWFKLVLQVCRGGACAGHACG
jgi:hypothetical protein